MIIWVKYGEKIGCDCIRPMGRYISKELMPCNFFMTEVNE